MISISNNCTRVLVVWHVVTRVITLLESTLTSYTYVGRTPYLSLARERENKLWTIIITPMFVRTGLLVLATSSIVPGLRTLLGGWPIGSRNKKFYLYKYQVLVQVLVEGTSHDSRWTDGLVTCHCCNTTCTKYSLAVQVRVLEIVTKNIKK